jgi:glycosyltransferase involved in cell wall biosynthesis
MNSSDDRLVEMMSLRDMKNYRQEDRLKGRTNNAKKLLISIITVVYNGEKHIEETIQSISNQTYDNVEYIIIDGGSTDDTLSIIQRYEENIDYWLSEKDNGIYDAMNKGISLCNGDIIGIVNADDYLYLDSLEKVANAFKDDMLMYTYGQVDLITEDGEQYGIASSLGVEHIKYKVFKHMPFLHPTMFIRRAVYEEVGLYNLDYKLSADYDFVLRLVEHDFKGKRLDSSTGVFREGGASGGLASYKENHRILLEHKTTSFLVYLNTFILVVKLYFRKFFNK